jgi:peptidoglycan/LPS O-acetylase OafA/YrhL
LKSDSQEHDRYNPAVNGLRGLLALMVLLFHAGNSHLPTFPLLQSLPGQFAVQALQSAVEIFFCISGYVIVGSLRRAPSPAIFLANRFWRIVPLLWITVTVAFAMEIVGHRQETAGLTPPVLGVVYLANLVALPGVAPIRALHDCAWSISYELIFYLLCAVAWQIRRSGGRSAAFAVAAGIVMIACYPRALFFVAGLLVAKGRVSHPVIDRLSRYPVVCLLVFFGAWQSVRLLCGGLFENGIIGWWADARLFLAPVAFVSLLVAFQGLAAGNGFLAKGLQTAPLQRLGTISYSFYLWQFPFMGALKKIMMAAGFDQALGEYSQLFFLAGSLCLTTLVAIASHALIETRLINLLRSRLAGRGSAASRLRSMRMSWQR